MLTHADFFAGIGGFTKGLQMTGKFETVVFCENNKFCQQVLAKNNPGVPIIGDIHDVTKDALSRYGIGAIDVATAGIPCQPFSRAGGKKGTNDQRFLWQELFRVIADIKPRFFILENVPEITTVQEGAIFAGILYDLWEAGYDAEWAIIPASAVGAPHKRERLWLVSYPNSQRQEWGESSMSQSERGRYFDTEIFSSSRRWDKDSLPETRVLRVDDGIRDRLHRSRNHALGNAVVPQLIQVLGERLIVFDTLTA